MHIYWQLQIEDLIYQYQPIEKLAKLRFRNNLQFGRGWFP